MGKKKKSEVPESEVVSEDVEFTTTTPEPEEVAPTPPAPEPKGAFVIYCQEKGPGKTGRVFLAKGDNGWTHRGIEAERFPSREDAEEVIQKNPSMGFDPKFWSKPKVGENL